MQLLRLLIKSISNAHDVAILQSLETQTARFAQKMVSQ